MNGGHASTIQNDFLTSKIFETRSGFLSPKSLAIQNTPATPNQSMMIGWLRRLFVKVQCGYEFMKPSNEKNNIKFRVKKFCDDKNFTNS